MMDPHANPGALIPINTPAGGFPEDLDPASMPPEFKKEGSDWFAMFNPKVKRSLDVSLVHTLMHERLVFFFFQTVTCTDPAAVWCAVCASLQMENTWRRAVIGQRRFTTQKQVKKLGECRVLYGDMSLTCLQRSR